MPEGIGLQGNLAPSLLVEATPEVVAQETRAVLEAMRGRPGHIFNLGHGCGVEPGPAMSVPVLHSAFCILHSAFCILHFCRSFTLPESPRVPVPAGRRRC
jgi:hypothetical protein